jgi:hypothetical protein
MRRERTGCAARHKDPVAAAGLGQHMREQSPMNSNTNQPAPCAKASDEELGQHPDSPAPERAKTPERQPPAASDPNSVFLKLAAGMSVASAKRSLARKAFLRAVLLMGIPEAALGAAAAYVTYQLLKNSEPPRKR